jgi:glutamyl-tRNA reductase
MRLEDLRVIHLSKKEPPTGMAKVAATVSARLPDVFRLDSCQRWIWIGCGDLGKFKNPVQVFTGVEAYRFLLSVACGLESEVVGETDIFGQLKDAWKAASLGGVRNADELGRWFQRIFEDTKDIRSRFLQNVGGHSYGSLARLLIKEIHPEARELGPLLLIGAGKIALAIAPYFCDRELLIYNRSTDKAEELRLELSKLHPQARITVLVDESEGWERAQDVVVCVPYHHERDQARIARWKSRARTGVILHLGGSRSASGEWAGLDPFLSLDDLFALRQRQGDVRSIQTLRAAAACEERAKLRGLGESITLPHGWEDLAAFA